MFFSLGGIVLTASHNPGGIRHDFGIKYNIENGGPAPDAISNDIYDNTKTINEYKITAKLETDRLIDVLGTTKYKVSYIAVCFCNTIGSKFELFLRCEV